jgi:hypothetical protein
MDMKLGKFFLMTALVGTLSILGCSDDSGSGGSGGTPATGGSGGSGATGGTGGSGGDPGTGGTGGTEACTEGELCCIELCINGDRADEFRGVCLDEYSDCTGGGGNPDTCKTAAEETCTI